MALKISSTPEMNMPNILKIEKLLNDSAYSELIEFSANFNTKLCVERKLRLPFLDPQTGVAQKHSNLYMKRTQRMPGMREGQIYTYPSLRWRNKSSSLKLSSRPFFRFRAADNCTTTIPTPVLLPNPVTNSIVATTSTNNAIINSSSTNNAVDGETSDFQAMIDESNSMTGVDTDSKDSSQEVMPKEWYYDDMNDNDAVSEEQPDSDFDYNINGYKRKKRGPVRKGSRKTKDSFGGGDESNSIPKKSRSSAGGRSTTTGNRNSRSKKSRSSKSNNNNNNNTNKKGKSEPLELEPPSFDSVQDDLKLNDSSADSFGYRKFRI